MLWETNQFDHDFELTGIYLLLSRSPKFIFHQTKLKVVFISLHKFMSQLEILCCSCVIASVRRGVLPRGYGDLYLGQDCIKCVGAGTCSDLVVCSRGSLGRSSMARHLSGTGKRWRTASIPAYLTNQKSQKEN